MLIFICLGTRQATRATSFHVLQKPLRALVARRLSVPSPRAFLCERPALNTATASRGARGWAPPPNMDTWVRNFGTAPDNYPSWRANPILSRFSFQDSESKFL